MSDFSAGAPATSTDLLFIAPPSVADAEGVDHDTFDNADSTPRRPSSARSRGQRTSASAPKPTRSLRMLKGAREAAAGMKVSEADIRAVLDDPQDVQPDPTRPDRSRFRGNGLVVTTGQDGMILRVARRR